MCSHTVLNKRDLTRSYNLLHLKVCDSCLSCSLPVDNGNSFACLPSIGKNTETDSVAHYMTDLWGAFQGGCRRGQGCCRECASSLENDAGPGL